MDLLEPGGRKFVELGSGSPPEEEGADAAITPETLCQSAHLKKPGHFFFLLYSPPKPACELSMTGEQKHPFLKMRLFHFNIKIDSSTWRLGGRQGRNLSYKFISKYIKLIQCEII